MAADEQGYDPDQDYTRVDNEFWDGTDGAHPAWWRGEAWGTIRAMQVFSKIFYSGQYRGQFADPDMHRFAQDLADAHGPSRMLIGVGIGLLIGILMIVITNNHW